MFVSGLLRAAVFAVPAVLAASGVMAQQRIITLAPGMTVVVNPPGTADPALRLEGLFAPRQAPVGSPADSTALIGSMMDRMSGRAPGAAAPPPGGVQCQESVSITFPPGGVAPVMTVKRAGDGCGPEQPRTVPMPGVTPESRVDGASPRARPNDVIVPQARPNEVTVPRARPNDVILPRRPEERPRTLEINEPAPVAAEPPVRRRT